MSYDALRGSVAMLRVLRASFNIYKTCFSFTVCSTKHHLLLSHLSSLHSFYIMIHNRTPQPQFTLSPCCSLPPLLTYHKFPFHILHLFTFPFIFICLSFTHTHKKNAKNCYAINTQSTLFTNFISFFLNIFIIF